MWKQTIYRPMAMCLLVSLCAALSPVLADQGKGKTAEAAAHLPSLPWAEGVVEDVSIENQWVILKHGPIENLHMEPMTMAFVVRDTSALSKMKVGDKVRFKAVLEGGDAVIVMSRRVGK